MINKKEVWQFVESPEEEFAYQTSAVLTGVNLRPKEESVLMVVKRRTPQGANEVAFIETDSFFSCWEYLAMYCYREKVPLRWRPDQWAK